MASPRISEQVWRERVALWRDSGLPLQAYAEQSGYTVARLAHATAAGSDEICRELQAKLFHDLPSSIADLSPGFFGKLKLNPRRLRSGRSNTLCLGLGRPF